MYNCLYCIQLWLGLCGIPYLNAWLSSLAFSPLSVCAVLAELQEAEVITSAENERLRDLSDVVVVQSGKSPHEMAKTAKILRKHGFDGESKFLSGKQA